MKYAGTITAIVLLANLLLVTMMYLTVGWHFIRGYNEVGNFLVFSCVIAQAGFNFLLTAAIVLVALVASDAVCTHRCCQLLSVGSCGAFVANICTHTWLGCKP